MPKRRRSTKPRTAGTRTRSPAASLSVADLQRELRRRQRAVKTLHSRRAKLLAKIAGIDAQILARAGTIASQAGLTVGLGPRATRPRNETNLIEALHAVLKGKTMGVAEAAEAVQKAGYRTGAASFRIMVNAALLKKKFFKRVERGRYTAV